MISWRNVRKLLLRLIAVVVLLSLIIGFFAWYKLFRQVPQQFANTSAEEYFKYGSIGTEEGKVCRIMYGSFCRGYFLNICRRTGGSTSYWWLCGFWFWLGARARNACWLFQENHRLPAHQHQLCAFVIAPRLEHLLMLCRPLCPRDRRNGAILKPIFDL